MDGQSEMGWDSGVAPSNGAFLETWLYLPQFTFVFVKSKLSARYNISHAHALSDFW